VGFPPFIAEFLSTHQLEVIASLTGFATVYLVIKRSVWCWPVGLLQVSLYIFIFYEVKLYSDMVLHIAYIFMQIYGWWYWTQNKRHHGDIRVIALRWPKVLMWTGVSIAISLALGWIMATYTDAEMAYLDAFVAGTSLVAQWLLSRRYLSNWWFWIVEDIVAIDVCLRESLFPTAALHAVFIFLAFYGLWSWWKEYRSYPRENQSYSPA
jgi:nicotinamide mononucleotide transporter